MSDEIAESQTDSVKSINDFSTVAMSPEPDFRSPLRALSASYAPLADYDSEAAIEALPMSPITPSRKPIKDILGRSKPLPVTSDGDDSFLEDDDDSSSIESDSGPNSGKNLWTISKDGKPPSLSKLHAAHWSKDQDPW